MEPAIDHHPPSTPSRARSLEPSSVRGDPMEDPDSSSTRKRPRLDSGDRSYRSMSAEPSPHSPLRDIGAKELRPSPLAISTPSSKSAAVELAPAAPPTPSKVTINIREPASATTEPLHQEAGHLQPLMTGMNGLPPPTDDAASVAPSSAPVPANLSPSRSPEIEIAEVEDMDSEPAQTRWRPMGGINLLQAKTLQDDLLSEFAYSNSGTNLLKGLDIISSILEKRLSFSGCEGPQTTDVFLEDLSSAGILTNLSTWIENYLEQTNELSSYWYDLFVDQRDFWEEFPNLAESILRRRYGQLSLEPSISG